MPRRKAFDIGTERVAPGETRDLRLKVSETFSGDAVTVPLRIIHSGAPGPVVYVLGAVHGNEINGTGVIRELMFHDVPALKGGVLICAPVVNIFGFETNDRDMPDRRDLNRSFPGTPKGSLTSRVAHTIFEEIIRRSDYGIDLHAAGAGRTNFPNVRADLRTPGLRALTEAFGCELIVNGKGPEGALRRSACEAGVPTLILEAGEVSKMEQGVVDVGLRGVRNALIALDMLDGEVIRPAYQTVVSRTTWVRAELGGLLRFYVAPGDVVDEGQPLASNESVFGEARSEIVAPVGGVVLGMTTHPAVTPGEPVCHIAVPRKSLKSIRRALEGASTRSLGQRVRRDLASGIIVSDVGSADG